MPEEQNVVCLIQEATLNTLYKLQLLSDGRAPRIPVVLP